MSGPMTPFLPALTEEQWKDLENSEQDASIPPVLPAQSTTQAFAEAFKKNLFTTGVRRCWGCHTLYAAAAAAPTPGVCPVCHSEHTERVSPDAKESDFRPIQKLLLTLPDPPRAISWCLEWKWKPRVQQALASVIDPSVLPAKSLNDWVRHSHYNITTERQAINQARRLRKNFPGKKYRVTPVAWAPVPLL